MRIPMKGLPDFTSLSDEKVKEYVELAQQMIFAYEHCDAEKTRVLTEIWKQLSDEHTDRLCALAHKKSESKEEKEVVPPALHKIKTIKHIKR